METPPGEDPLDCRHLRINPRLLSSQPWAQGAPSACPRASRLLVSRAFLSPQGCFQSFCFLYLCSQLLIKRITWAGTLVPTPLIPLFLQRNNFCPFICPQSQCLAQRQTRYPNQDLLYRNKDSETQVIHLLLLYVLFLSLLKNLILFETSSETPLAFAPCAPQWRLRYKSEGNAYFLPECILGWGPIYIPYLM